MEFKETFIEVLRQSGALANAISDVHDFLIVRMEAERLALSPPTDLELQGEADRFRRSRGLLTTEQFNRWFSSQIAFTWADFESLISYEVLRQKVKARAILNAETDEIATFRQALQVVSLTTIVIGEEGLCRELKSMIEDEDEDIHSLAERYSRHPISAPFGGRMGPRRLLELPTAVWRPVTAGSVGSLVGPMLVEEDWWISRIDGKVEVELDAAEQEVADEAWFRTWLDKKRSALSFSIQVQEDG
ncbi:hypothetical protein [Bradyrhizobium murdochi]|uniref:hypothetical protein n=1 Tax=Bradyrhizobium murdochi TaxID=1038859 RepID=UPI0012EBF6B6|nr:hypothetical protein [Bradyrhizobium murdochi]